MLEDMGRDQMRAADADRQQVAERLRVALDEGRLDLGEYDERLQRAYAAKTYEDLDVLVADLPVAASALPAAAAPAVERRGATAAWLSHLWSSWAKTAAILTVIWLLPVLLGAGSIGYWPAWALGPWGAVLLVQTVTGLATGKHREFAEEQEFQRRLRAHQREREALEAAAIARGELPASATKEQRQAFVAEAIARGALPPRPQPPNNDRSV